MASRPGRDPRKSGRFGTISLRAGLHEPPADPGIPLPPFGVLRLHPSGSPFVGDGSLDPQGRATVTVPVPPVPALVGFTFYEQALVGPPFRLTNHEVVTSTAS